MLRNGKSIQESWRRTSTATRLLIVSNLSAVLLVSLLLGAAFAIISRAAHINADADLDHHLSAVASVLEREIAYLETGAQFFASTHDFKEGLALDGGPGSLELVQSEFQVDGIYCVSPNGETVAHAGQVPPDIAHIPSVAAVLDRAAAGSSGGIAVIGDSAFVIAGAPQVGLDGGANAVVLLAREIDADFMQRLHRQYGPEIVLKDADVWISSLPPESLAKFMSHEWGQATGLSELPASTNVRIGDIVYRLRSQNTTLAPDDAVTLAVLQPVSLARPVIWQTIGPFAILGLLLIAANFTLSYFLIHAVFRPLESLRQVAEKMAGGDLSQPEPIRGTVEVESLSDAFDRMRMQLKDLIEAQQEWNEQLETQVQERTAELNQLHRQRNRLLVKLVSEQEEQQRRVARDLHDDTSQVLANLSVNLGRIAASTEDSGTERQLREAKQMAVDALEGLGRIVQDLRPRALNDFGLQTAIQWHMRHGLGENGTAVDVQVEGTEVHLPSHVETYVYRIVQEAVNNIRRHAYASKAWMFIRWNPTGLRIEIGDNGRGFAPEDIQTDLASGRGLGLLGMQERAEFMNGVFAIQSTPDEGTTITIDVPISDRSYTHDTD